MHKANSQEDLEKIPVGNAIEGQIRRLDFSTIRSTRMRTW